ncbi:uncharacterized protein KD926_011138 [Aspergillus affinis]|uniref:uncharacterized protein n=1 Tax=Aspergillus affinis TaxID=1070780 RepID=UPI0022FDED5C|nr:uncharacterized protein KD926_011138 [Aspergillus affinis]KAI9038199.1 hypothetical protein KD926_011138 [Aspergillus affinis]
MTTRHHTYAPETPISTDRRSNDSADKERSGDQPSNMMEDMRAGLLRQLREEMAQQLREEIRREMHAEQHQPSTQQQHQETNRDTSYERNAEIRQLDLVYREQEHIRKLAKSKFGTRKPTTLNGRDNYTTWRDSIQMDAHMIEAKEILDQTNPPDGSNEIDIARWQTKNEILHTRILQTIASHVRETISWEDSTLAAEIWARITSTYGLSAAEERIMTVKALLDINPQGNYPAMIRDFQRIAAKLRRMNLTTDDLIHDIFICSLGQWNQNFIRTKLDEFYSSGRGPIKNLNIATLADQLVARAPSSASSNKYVPQNPQEFKLETKLRLSPTELKDSPQTKRDSQDQRSTRTKTRCQACGKGYHKPDDCWTLHPEKAPKRHENPTSNATTSDEKNQAISKELVLRNNSQANSIIVTQIKKPNEPQWLLDTAADFHVSNRYDIFSNLQEYNAAIDDAGSHTHRIAGIGTISVYGIEISDVRYSPTMKANLLSFRQLDKQNFDISLLGAVNEKYFLIRTPTGASLSAHPEENTDLYQVKPIACAVKSEHRTKDVQRNDQKEDNPAALPTATMEEWHRRLSHIHFRAILKLAQQKILKIKGPKTLAFCDICSQAKQKRQSTKDPASRATKILARIHIDIAGGGATLDCKDEEAPPGIKNIRYFMLITDDATRFRWVYTLRTKDEAIPTFQGWLKHIKNQGFNSPAFVRSDREFITETVRTICQTYGIVWEPTTADSPWQDGVSERGIQTVLQRTRATLYDSGLPRWLWPQALQTAVHHLNRTSTRVPLYNDRKPMAPISDPNIQPCTHITPYSAWTNGTADIKHLTKFGSPAWMHLHGASKSAGKPTSKLDPRAKKVHVVGYQGSHIYVVWDPEINQLRQTSDISINEEFKPLLQRSETNEPSKVSNTREDLPTEDVTAITSRDVFYRPAKGFAILKSSESPLPEPKSYREAIQGSESKQWLEAMQEEVNTLKRKHCWDLIRKSDMPAGTRAIPGRWVYKKKLNPDDSIRYKTRWVVRGNLLDKSTFEGTTYAPVIDPITSRILLAVSAQKGWHIIQADAVLAFLNAKLKGHPIYMHQPLGFTEGEPGTLVCSLRQSLYGLTPSARLWYDDLRAYLESIGFKVSPHDSGLFVHATKKLYITTHVDDFMIIGEDAQDATQALEDLKSRFEIKDVPEIKRYLGMNVKLIPTGIQLSQEDTINELIDSFGLHDAHPTKSPLDPGTVIDDSPDVTINIKEFQRGTGSLQYLATKTRPDISRAACFLAEFNAAPTAKCWAALMHVIKYLKGTRTLGIKYQHNPTATAGTGTPEAYSDSDWGGPHTKARKSVGGYVFKLAGGPIAWQAKRQTCVATSSNEAEYIAASETSREACWIREIMKDLRLFNESPAPCIPMHMDNKGAIDLTTSDMQTKRSKHIDIRYHYTRDMIDQGIIQVKQIPTADMVADGCTKPLGSEAHSRFVQLLGLQREDK